MTEPSRALNDDSWMCPDRPLAQHYVISLMSFFHGRVDDPYPKTIQFSKEEFLQLKPSDIKRWLAFRAHNDPDPGPNDQPTNERASSLKKAKHDVSMCMPDWHLKWMGGLGGNPTQHVSITQFIGEVERKETRGQGRPANDKREHKEAEHFKVSELLRASDNFDHRWKRPMILWSHHLIDCLDDSCHFKVNDPHGSHARPFTLLTKTKWSKNIWSPKQCPDQIILGAADWRTCTVVNLANCLEMWLGMHLNTTHLFTTDKQVNEKGTPLGPLNINKTHANQIKTVCWEHEEFKALEDEVGEHKGIGAHSNRKHAADRADEKGAETHQIEFRGRWTGKKGQRVVHGQCMSSER